jgi:hypothetical protein
MRFESFTAVKFWIGILCVVTPSSHVVFTNVSEEYTTSICSVDEGSRFLFVTTYMTTYTVSQHRRSQSQVDNVDLLGFGAV